MDRGCRMCSDLPKQTQGLVTQRLAIWFGKTSAVVLTAALFRTWANPAGLVYFGDESPQKKQI
ncbi:hypothetical protein CGZ80_19645 [Rhodopirellula sp. MGV]|nr:hypothetical protein CGZ80_19645 [Rhodopirellula sp. MGV]PNY35933.1 hypothetical protein C2E31_15835 [Rhodopirellula baltica]